MLPVAEYFHRQGVRVYALIGWTGKAADDSRRRCEALGFDVLITPYAFAYHAPDEADCDSKELDSTTTAKKEPGASIGRRVKNIIRANSSLRILSESISHLLEIRRVARYAEGIVAGIEPDAYLAGPFQSCGRVDNALLSVCNSREIGSYCLPVSAYLGERLQILNRYNNLNNGMLSAELLVTDCLAIKLIAKYFPKWVRSWNEMQFFIHVPSQMLASYLAGMLEENPWQKPSEQFDLVFAESDFSRDMLIQSNFPPGKVVVSGKPLLDSVFQDMADASYLIRLYADLELKPNEPFILFNVEPSAEHHYESWDVHWQHFSGLMDALFKLNVRVVLSLHPLCDPNNYRFVREKYGFIVSECYKITSLYPCCTLVVSFPCSTNTFSSIFKKPLIIYDWYGLTRKDYSASDLFRFDGAMYVYDMDYFSSTVESCLASLDSSREQRHSLHETNACEGIYKGVKVVTKTCDQPT